MSKEKPPADRRLKWAACAVAVATAVGGSSIASADDGKAIEQLQRYCTASWRNAGIDRQDWPDCTQQALSELIERVSDSKLATAIDNRESPERRELNRSVWRTVQRWRRSPRSRSYDEVISTSIADSSCVPDAAAWDEVMSAATAQLTGRQTRVLALIRDGWRVREIADELDITPARVSDEKYKAIHKLRRHFGIDV